MDETCPGAQVKESEVSVMFPVPCGLHGRSLPRAQVIHMCIEIYNCANLKEAGLTIKGN
jgi:hypothetical protein